MTAISYIGVVDLRNRSSSDNYTYVYLRLSSGIPATIYSIEVTANNYTTGGVTALINSNQRDHVIKFTSPYPATNTGLVGDLLVSLKDAEDNLIATGSIPIVVLN